MKKTDLYSRYLSIFFILVFLLSACAPGTTTAPSTAGEPPTDIPAFEDKPMLTETTVPTDTPEQTATDMAEPTVAPTITFTSTNSAVLSITPLGESLLDPALNDKSPIPVTGEHIPELMAFDTAMVDFMVTNGIGAGTLAVSKGGMIVLEHGYGWFDQEKTIPTNPETMFRVASVSKPITLAAVEILVDEGKLSNNTSVFCLDGGNEDCVLQIGPPEGKEVDARMGDITIRHLKEHEGGWDRDAKSYDPMFDSIRIARELGVDTPPDEYQIAQFMLGQPLDFTPGEKHAYSNFGYMLLGLVILEVTGLPYEEYVKQVIFVPLEVYDVEMAVTLPQERDNPREISYYHCPGQGENVFHPGQYVCWADGGYAFEAMDAHGGWVASGRAIATFIDHYCIGNGWERRDICGTWWFIGSLDGTHAMAFQTDDLSIVTIFNRRGPNSEMIHDVMEDVMNGIEVWP